MKRPLQLVVCQLVGHVDDADAVACINCGNLNPVTERELAELDRWFLQLAPAVAARRWVQETLVPAWEAFAAALNSWIQDQLVPAFAAIEAKLTAVDPLRDPSISDQEWLDRFAQEAFDDPAFGIGKEDPE